MTKAELKITALILIGNYIAHSGYYLSTENSVINSFLKIVMVCLNALIIFVSVKYTIINLKAL